MFDFVVHFRIIFSIFKLLKAKTMNTQKILYQAIIGFRQTYVADTFQVSDLQYFIDTWKVSATENQF